MRNKRDPYAHFNTTPSRLARPHRRIWKTSIWIALALTVLPLTAWSQDRPGGLVLRENRHGKLQVALHKSGIIKLSRAAAKVSVGNPDIADILVMPGDQLYILGKRLGHHQRGGVGQAGPHLRGLRHRQIA